MSPGRSLQRRQREREHVQTEGQVRPEQLAAHQILEVEVRRRDDPDVGAHEAVGAERLVGPFLEETKDLSLGRKRQRVHLVEQQRAAFRHAHQPSLVPMGVRERAARMTEQLVLEQMVRQSAAVHGNERGVPARTEVMNRPGAELLARAGLANDQHGTVRPGDEGNLREGREECGIVADQRGERQLLNEPSRDGGGVPTGAQDLTDALPELIAPIGAPHEEVVRGPGDGLEQHRVRVPRNDAQDGCVDLLIVQPREEGERFGPRARRNGQKQVGIAKVFGLAPEAGPGHARDRHAFPEGGRCAQDAGEG